MNFLDNKKILLTGGSGFLGKNIVEEIRKRHGGNTLIYNLGRTELFGSNIVNLICEDVSLFNFEKINEEFDYIIHTLALSNESYCKDFDYANAVNVDFTNRLLEFASKQSSLKKFVHISTIFLYSNNNPCPVNEDGDLYLHYSNYGFTKGIAEKYVNHYLEKFKLPVVIFRLSNIYGPYQESKNSPFLVPSKISSALNEGKIEVFNLTPRRDWIYSEDAAQAIIKSLEHPDTGIFNLGSGTGLSVRDLISEIATQLNVSFISLDKPTNGPENFYCDISKTTLAFSWKPTTNLHDGIKNTIEYVKNNMPDR